MNPFDIIEPLEDELVNEDFITESVKKIKSKLDKKRFIIFEGDYGSGKSHILKRIYKRLRTKKEFLYFTDAIVNILKNKVPVKNKTIIIDNFDFVEGFDENKILELTNAIINLVNAQMIIITALRKENIKRLFDVNPLIRSKAQKIKIPPLTLEETKEFVLRRLNRKDFFPFTEFEIKQIWSAAKGNPRLILLLLKHLYDERMFLRDEE